MKLDRIIGLSLAVLGSLVLAQGAFAGTSIPINIYIGPDFNNDGKTDMVLVDDLVTGFAIGYQMDGLTQSLAAAVPGTYTPYTELAWRDIDGDGRTDKIIQYDAAGVDVLDGFEVALKAPADIGVAAGVWTAIPVPGSFQSASMSTVGFFDVDGDGKRDKIWQNANGWTGSITSVATQFDTFRSIPGSYNNFVTTAFTDIDGDGKDDKVMEDSVTGYTVVSLIQDVVNQTFVNDEIPGSYNDFSTIGYADINGDGNVDKIMQIDNPADPADGYTVGVLLNDDLTYTLIELPGLYNDEESLGFPDMNGDGQADQVIRAGSAETDAVSVCIYGDATGAQMVVTCTAATAMTGTQIFGAFVDLNDDQKSDRLIVDTLSGDLLAITHDGATETSAATTIVSAPSTDYNAIKPDQFWDQLN